MLPAYAATFSAVEAHATYRRLPTAAALARWREQVPEDFRFALKAHMGITHRRDTDGLDERVAKFVAAIEPLGDRTGPVLFVLPHHQPDLERLDLLLAAVAGRALRAVFELAPGWWVDPVFERLAAAGASLAAIDRDDGPAREPRGPVAYVRLRRAAYTDADLAAWAARLVAFEGAGRDVYAFLKHDEGGDGPRYARDLVRKLEGA
jgi:uncharacterized protein YecE (DUF72 family)